MPLRRHVSLGFAAALWLSVVALAVLGPSRADLIPALVAYSVAFVSLLALWHRDPELLDDPRFLLGSAVILRLTFFPSLPDLSDDLYRYVWDGWIAYSGINPYRFVPSDPALVDFRSSDLFGSLNSPDYHSIYPPVSQLVFLTGGAAYDAAGWPAAAYTIKGVFLLMELGGLFLLFGAVRTLGWPTRVVALYALNPLVLVTLAGGGHSESGLVLGFGALAFGVAARRATLGWLGLVVAVGAKGIPLLIAPLLARRQWITLGPRRTIAAALPAFLLGIALLAPYYFPGLFRAVGSSVDLYIRLFEFNAGAYFLIEAGVRALTGIDWGRVVGPLLSAVLLLVSALVWIRWSVLTAEGFFRGCLSLMGLYLATATTVHPWYLTWGLVLVPLTPFLRGAWLWASWAAFPTYFVYLGVPQWPLALLFWGGVGVFLLLEAEPRIRDRLLRLAGSRKARQIEGEIRGDVLLDLGAGEGYVARHLARSGRKALLMDVGPFFRVPLCGVVYDGRHLPLPDGAVDTVLLSLALHHAEDPDQVLREALRVARQRVVVTESTYVWSWERRILTVADRWANRLRGMSEATSADLEAPRFRTVREWETAGRTAGGVVVRSRRLNRIGHRHHLIVLKPASRARL